MAAVASSRAWAATACGMASRSGVPATINSSTRLMMWMA